MTKAQILKKEILSQYRSVRQFAMDMQIPYSTLVTALERGIDGMAYELKSCGLQLFGKRHHHQRAAAGEPRHAGICKAEPGRT